MVLAAVGGAIALGRHLYEENLGPAGLSQQTKVITVQPGSTFKQVSADLAKQHLIRSAWAMNLYVHGRGVGSKLQAGSYALSPSESTPHIVRLLTTGRVSTELVTILPGRRIDQVRADLINYGFAPSAVDAALQPTQYADLPIMSLKPADVNSLEGLLWPDSFQKDATVGPDYIIRESLAEASQHVTADIQTAFNAEGLSPYQGLVLASMVEQEVGKTSDRSQVAQVFLSRLKQNIMLGSDVTANYGAIAAGRAPSLTFDSPYNTLLHKGLPPTPISTLSDSSLQAAAHPAATDWLFFVAGDNGTTYFSHTLQEHQALTQKYCHQLCSQSH